MEKKKIIGVSLLGLIVLLLTIFVALNSFSQNKEEVDNVVSMIDDQIEKEKNLKAQGYTLESPNVVLNPYGNSPLTA